MAARAAAVVDPGRLPAFVAGSVLLGAAIIAGLGVPLVALALAAPLALAIAARPQRGVLLLAALVPFDGLLSLADTPSFVNGWKEALVLVVLAATLVAPDSARAGPGRRLPGWAPAVIGLLLLGLASAVAVGGLRAGLGLKIGFFYLLLAVAVWRCPLDAHERDRLVTVLMVTGFVTALYGVAQQFIAAEALNALGYEYNSTIRFLGGWLRSFSTFEQPFPFALFLMIVVLVGLPTALTEPRRLRSLIFFGMLPVLLAGIVVTFVRDAWLGLAVGGLFLALDRHRGLLLLLPVVAVALLLIPSSITGRVFSTSSFSERASTWTSTFEQVARTPVGSGIGSAGSSLEKTQRVSLGELRARQLAQIDESFFPLLDNYYYKTAYEYGVLGVWLVVLLYASAFMSARSTSRRLRGRDAALASGVAATVLAAAAASFVINYLENFPMDVLFWLLLTVVATCDPKLR